MTMKTAEPFTIKKQGVSKQGRKVNLQSRLCALIYSLNFFSLKFLVRE
jgi:hypothetical protein